MSTHFNIDKFVLFLGTVHLAGWVFAEKLALLDIHFVAEGMEPIRLTKTHLASPDVRAVHGDAASHARFDERWITDASADVLVRGKLRIRFSNNTEFEIDQLGNRANHRDPAHLLLGTFQSLLQSRPVGRLLEIGSRARSGITRRHLAPKGWDYTGVDILDGENVDVVGDVHRLSDLFPANNFQAVMSFSVFEHVLMPWKAAVEINRILDVGGVGFLFTHQTWPMHDQPWDFWRFSAESWRALFNSRTGFAIIDAAVGEPAYVVANLCHPATNFGPVPAGFLASAVLFQKTSETDLDWAVALDEVVQDFYPATVTKFVG